MVEAVPYQGLMDVFGGESDLCEVTEGGKVGAAHLGQGGEKEE